MLQYFIIIMKQKAKQTFPVSGHDQNSCNKKNLSVLPRCTLGIRASGANVAPAWCIRSSAILLKYRVKGI